MCVLAASDVLALSLDKVSMPALRIFHLTDLRQASSQNFHEHAQLMALTTEITEDQSKLTVFCRTGWKQEKLQLGSIQVCAFKKQEIGDVNRPPHAQRCSS